mmetsp:Transcript_4975/g.12468  ORF Transcript_4975/g.12468 Transcript_4975/m.12468 type:complete len:320 (-) Transcript_4975:2498-3457(-)
MVSQTLRPHFGLELRQLILEFPHLGVGQSVLFLVLLQLFLDLLDEFLSVLVGHGLHLVHLNLVTGSVHNLVRTGLVRVEVVVVHHQFTLLAEAPSLHDPLLGTDLLGEFHVMGNNHHTATEVNETEGQSAEAVAIEVVGRFVQDEDVRVHPHRCGQYDLYFLSTGQRVDWRVACGLRVQPEVFQLLLHRRRRERLRHETCGGGLFLVLAAHHLLEPHGLHRVPLDPAGGLDRLVQPLHLVLVLLLLVLPPVEDAVGDDRNVPLLPDHAFAHHARLRVYAPLHGAKRLLIHVHLVGLVFQRLAIVVTGEAPEDVLDRGLV